MCVFSCSPSSLPRASRVKCFLIQNLTRSLTDQTRGVDKVAKHVASGDFTELLHVGSARVEMLDMIMSVNVMVAELSIFTCEIREIILKIGTEGTLGAQSDITHARGILKVRQS